MDQQRDELWQGGAWEQPSPVFPTPPPVHIPQPKVVRARRAKRRRWTAFVVMLALIGSLTGLTVLLGGTLSIPDLDIGIGDSIPGLPTQAVQTLPQAQTGSGVTVTISPQAEEKLSYTQVYEKNEPSIVSIHVIDQEGMGQGTGIVLTEDGYIITNAHVVQGAQVAGVVLSNDLSYEASLVGISPEEDLAVLKIDAQGLTPAEFGDSFAVKVGDEVSALGNPLGYRLTMTSGIVSAVDRQMVVEGSTMYLLQTNTAINFGNSGGALLNDRGQVIGVTTVKIISDDGSTEGLGFAIPTERVKYVVDQLIAGEEIKTPVLGITVIQEPGRAVGLKVDQIESWSDAKTKGMQVGDIITAVNGRPVRTNRELQRIKDLQRVGDSLTLSVERGGESLEFAIRLSDQAEHAAYN